MERVAVRRAYLRIREVIMSKLNVAQTIIVPAGDIPWQVPAWAPPESAAEAVLAGGEDQDGAYLVLMKWYPEVDEWPPHPCERPSMRGLVRGVVVQQRAGLRPVPSGSRLPGVSCAVWQEPPTMAAHEQTRPSPRPSPSVVPVRSGEYRWTQRSRRLSACKPSCSQLLAD
jgi:hypothetical protein